MLMPIIRRSCLATLVPDIDLCRDAEEPTRCSKRVLGVVAYLYL